MKTETMNWSLSMNNVVLYGLFTFLFFGVSGGDYWFDHYLGKWAVLMGVLSTYISYRVGEKTHWSVGAFVAILLLGSIRSFGYTFVDRDSVYTAFSLLTFVSFLAWLPKKYSETLITFFAVVCLASSAYTIAEFPLLGFYRAAFSGNASMNGCLIACTVPFFDRWAAGKRDRYLLLAPIVAAIYMTDASIPLGVLSVVIGAYLWHHCGWRGTLAAAASGALVLGIGALLQGEKILSTSGRTEYWKDVLTWWASSDREWLGQGTGTGRMIFQGMWRNKGHLNAQWAHSDWLQLLFENGLVGLTAGCLAFYFTLRAARNRTWLFAAVLGYGAMAFFNYPVHLPIHSFLGASLIWLAFQKEQPA
jgi:hypothetical protein